MPSQKICPACSMTFRGSKKSVCCSQACVKQYKYRFNKKTISLYFFSQVAMPSIPEKECWLWEGPVSGNGYGAACILGKTLSAHRVAYELLVGPIPEGLFVLHSCDEKRCVAPHHLRCGTQRDNIYDAVDRRRHMHGSTHYETTLTETDVEDILERFHIHNQTQSSIAKATGLTYIIVHHIIHRKTWTHICPDRYPAPTESQGKRLSDAEVQHMRALYDAGSSYRELAKLFSLSYVNTRLICLRRSYRDVPTSPPPPAPAAPPRTYADLLSRSA